MEKVQTITNTALEGEYSVLQTAEGDGKSRKEAKYSKFPINRQIVREINRRDDLEEYKKATASQIIKAIEDNNITLEHGENMLVLFSGSELFPEIWHKATPTGKKLILLIQYLVYQTLRKDGARAKTTAPKPKGAIDTQLAIFPEIIHQGGEAEIPYNLWAWAQEIYDKKAPAFVELKRLEAEIEKLKTQQCAVNVGGSRFFVSPILEKRAPKLVDLNTKLAAEKLCVHPALVQDIGAKPFCLVPAPRAISLLKKDVEINLLALLVEYYTNARGAIEKAQAAGKEEPHTELKERFLEKLYRGSKRELSKRRGRIEKDVINAFEKMMLPEIGLIKPNSFKCDERKYSWIWNPGYRNGK